MVTFHRGAPRARAASRRDVGDEQQDDLGGACDHGQHEQRQRERALVAGERGSADLGQHERDVDEEAEDDRRDAGHDVDEVAHGVRELRLLAELDEVERDADPERDRR